MGFFSGKKKELPQRRLYAENMPAMTENLEEVKENRYENVLSDQIEANENGDLYESKEPNFSNIKNTEIEVAKGNEEEKWNAYCKVLDDFMEMEQLSVYKEGVTIPQAEIPKVDVVPKETQKGSDLSKEEEKEKLLNEVLDYFIANEGKLLLNLQKETFEIAKHAILEKAKEQFQIRNITGEAQTGMLDRFSRYLWGYYILDPLIEDRTIFDIKCYSDTHIRIKRMGERMDAPTNIRFSSPADYARFVRMAATKNQVNLSVINALATFTDKETNPDFILRFNISTEYINSSSMPCLHIRKLAKNKYSMSELVGLGFMTEEERAYFEEKAASSGGILFTGSGGSGKTTFMNSLLEVYPHNRSALVIQENEELFTKTHPDMNFQHVVTANGEGKISYTLEDLARQGLLDDIDLFVIGEIKGKEAGSFAMCSYTGAQAWCSCHGKNEKEAIYKLADYVKMATGYSLSESLKVLSGIEVIVYIKDFHIEGVSEIKGWDYEKETLRIEKKTFGKKEEIIQEKEPETQKEALLKSLAEFTF